MPSKSAPTLRARRSGRVPKETNLDRTRLISDPDIQVESKSSPAKSIIWFVMVVILALLTYLGLKTYLTDNTEQATEPTLTPTLASEDNSILSDRVLTDDPVEAFSNTTYWNENSKQIQSTSSDTQFVVEDLLIQPYESYMSFIFTISGGSVSDFPQVTAEMLEDISLTIENVSLNSSKLSVGEEVILNNQTLLAFTRVGYSDQIDSYLVDLAKKSSFALYSKVENEKKLVILDVLYINDDELEDVSPTQSTTPTPNPTTSVSPTSLPPGAENYQNEYSQTQQKIVSSVTGKSVKITKYNYADASDRFTYNLLVSEGIPNAEATIDGETLTLKVSNLLLDGVVGNGGSGSTDLAATGVLHVQNVEISNSDGVSTYVFTLDRARDYKLTADEESGMVTLQIKH